MRKSLVFFVAIAAIVLVLTGSDAARSQDSEDIPPQVIDIWPLPGVELSPDDPLTLTFNQPMDQASVEAAFQSDPAFESSFTWTDARTVNILPAAGWQRATDYTVTIAASAVAQNGLSLPDPVQIEVKTVGPLEVASVVPEDGAEGVAADARIVVTFNRPVVPLVSTEQLDELPDPITIEPALEGTGEWLNTGIYVFNPAEALSGGAEYTITVTAGLTSVDGAVLDTDYAWSFETLPPQILGITPTADQEGVLLDANVEIRFSQPMDQPSAEEAFYLLSGGDRVAGSFTWDQNSTVMSFIPDENLTIDQTYLINIADSARSAAGEATLGRGYSQSFRTVPYPGVRSTWPLNGDRDVHPGSGASIEFKSPMNTDTLQGLIEISPEPEEWMPVVWGNQSLNLDFRSLPETTYTITLKAGAEDIYGNAIKTDYTFSYTTRAIDTWASPILSWGARLMLTGAHRQDTRFSILVSGSPTVSYQVFAIPDDDMVSIAEEMIRERSYYYDEELPPWARDENLLRTWEETYDSAGIEGVPKEVHLASEEGGTLPNGTYWVIIKAPDRGDGIQTFQFGLSVTSANLTVKRGPNEALVWVTDMPSAEPVQETTVTIYHKGQAIARGQTDAEGVFKAPTSLPESDDFIFIVAEGAGVYGVWFSNSDRDLPTENNYIYTDRPIYRPGETVYFRGVLRDRNDMDYQIP
ncbi:MAG: hypothetical protein GYB66_11855, partial [Chloroflexi bacterium]|nr:hypothetical protein [Chloroflexota bacterium]